MIKSNMTIKQITSQFIEKYKIDDEDNPKLMRNKIYHKVNEVIRKDLKLKGYPINGGKRKEYTPEQVKEIEKYMQRYLRKRSSDEEIRNPFTPAYITELRLQHLEEYKELEEEIEKYQVYLLNGGVNKKVPDYKKHENELKLDAIFNIFFKDFDKKQYYKDLKITGDWDGHHPYDVSDDTYKAMERLRQPELYYFTRR